MKKLVFLMIASFPLWLNAQKPDTGQSGKISEITVKLVNWEKPFLIPKELNDSNYFVSYSDSAQCNVVSYSVLTIIDGFLKQLLVNSNKIDSNVINFLKMGANGGPVIFENITVRFSNGMTRIANAITFKKWNDEFDGFVKAALSDDVFLNDFGVFNSDIRIKIQGSTKQEYMRIVATFVEDLKPFISSVDLKLVNYAPSLIVEIREVKNEIEGNLSVNEYVKNPFFPNLCTKYKIINVPQSKDNNYIKGLIYYELYQTLAQFNPFPSTKYSEWDKTLAIKVNYPKPATSFTEFDRNLIKMLYSHDGLLELKHRQYVKTFKQDETYLLYIIISLLLFVIMSEINRNSNFFFFVEKIKSQTVRRIIFSIFIVQIPLLVFLALHSDLLSFMKFIKLELFCCLFAIILSLFLLIIDLINQKYLKNIGLRLLFDSIFITIAFITTYQLVLLIERPEILKTGILQLNWLFLPLVVTGYRFYLNYSQRRLSGIIQEKEHEIIRQREMTLKSDLLSLQSRVNPHFLYNSLNSIATLARINPSKTEEMTLSLAKLFRYNINKSGELLSTVAQEVEMTKIYLDVEKIRFSDKLVYHIEVNKVVENNVFPVFILQPLVENSLKHGISKLSGQGIIRLKIDIENDWLVIDVFDNGEDFMADIKPNYGLQGIYDKLNLIYKDKFTIEFSNVPEKRVEIRIKQ